MGLTYISLLVHEKPQVVLNQLANFARFSPRARVVVHISPAGNFTPEALEHACAERQLNGVIINREQVPTTWGGVLYAHFANIRLIKRQGDAYVIAFHASNDMLVRAGLDDYLDACPNLFNERYVRPGSLWLTGCLALRDEALARLCRSLGDAPIIGSQIEGLTLSAALAFEAMALIERWEVGRSQRFPAEEVCLSTVARALGVAPRGRPYVFAEMHRFDRVFWRVVRRNAIALHDRARANRFLRRCVEYLIIKRKFYRIHTRDIDAIASGDVAALSRYRWMEDGDGHAPWEVFTPGRLYGVKRIPRELDAPLRRYINGLVSSS